ncbi:NAD(P)H-hydrate epimerase [Abditibacterium utsteinense]|uniref:Bifunctional NAD(P)H-hydrate repair enzyme n=1 Tax=Abditibacterium utsteinense TaxID=1960156 RepID=A0A2S8SWY1_9BACT|nr:NAD(P)H-hydrate dehydratase [Abditibacterium utsteinense]PQV65307.1 NAD(P)H-hydrate epimerase [Abditibacterium utsteinense]
MKVFTAQQMRDFDRAAVEEYGIPSIVLMENAALRVVEFLEAKFAPLSEKKIVILCGKGNNGGDGLAIARHLDSQIRVKVVVYLSRPKTDYQGDALTNLRAFEQTAVNIIEFDDSLHMASLEKHLFSADVVIDALCGTGFSGEVRDEPLRKLMDECFSLARICVGVDLPSGLDANTGVKPMDTPRCSHTVTFASPKRGIFLRDGIGSCGEVWVGDIGSVIEQMWESEIKVETLDLETAQFLIPKRTIDAHKGDAGRALIIGGSFGMSGAVALASKAALNSGCGLCIAAMPEKVLPIFAASILEATSHPLPCDESGKLLERAAEELPELWKGVQVVALGPGIGRSEETQNLVRRIVRECPVPLVIDADALHALPSVIEDVKNREAETILTPHPGEMGTLMGISASEVNDNRFETVEACAQKYGAIVVLKGARTLVATPKGQTFVNLTGNAGMATGGSGDVLTGTIAGLLAQLKNSEDATKLGVYLHGFAGDLAFEEHGNGLVAGDITSHLGRALVEIPKREVERINGRLRKLM